jgi:hypothetical protein
MGLGFGLGAGLLERIGAMWELLVLLLLEPFDCRDFGQTMMDERMKPPT